MRGVWLGVIALLLAACNAGKPAPEAQLWTTRDFNQPRGAKSLGGWWPDELLTRDGEPLRFQRGTQTGSDGLTLFPAVSGGKVAPFVITEIWEDHPEPWVQPVWAPLDESGEPVMGVKNVFPVDVDSTFYSPFWRAELLLTPGLTPETYQSARDVLNARGVDRRSGSVIFCPIVPAGVAFANDGSGSKDPVTLQPATLPSTSATAWVDEKQVTYFVFGLNRAQSEPADEQDLIETPAYFFVDEKGDGRPLPLAAVLTADAQSNSLVRRVDVVLPKGAGAFVPAARPELKALLEAHQLTVFPTSPASEAFPEFTLRVATNPACFTDVNFPAACTWLDTPEVLEALPVGQRTVRNVQLAIGVSVLP